MLINDSSNRLNELAAFPADLPEAGKVNNDAYYANEVLDDVAPPFWDAGKRMMNLPPIFNWGGRIGAAPPNQRYPGWLNINRTQDVAASITKVMGRHTMKAGFYNNHSFKAQNVGAGGGLSFQGTVDFGNDTNNAIDTGFGYANAATGVFTRYQQASDFIEGQMVYDNTEFYIQDNWKLNSRTTLDYGVRFTHQGPQYDKNQAMSNFFPELWNGSQAQTLYVPGCNKARRSARATRSTPWIPATARSAADRTAQAAIGTPIPGSGNPLNGIRQAGDGIAKTGYTWPAIVVGPRFGVAYDISGNQMTVLRAGGGIYYDRPDGNTVFSIPGNPPIANSADLRYGQLQTLTQGLNILPNPQLVTFQYEAKVPGQWQWQAGVQRALPWAMAIDLSYVGNHGFNRMGGLQGGNVINLNSIDLGTAYLAKYQDPTKAAQHRSRRDRADHQPAAALPGAGQHQPEHHGVLGHLPLPPGVVEPPLPERLLVRCELHLRDFVQGQHRPADPLRPQRGRQFPAARRPGRVREAQRDARPTSAFVEGKRGVGSA